MKGKSPLPSCLPSSKLGSQPFQMQTTSKSSSETQTGRLSMRQPALVRRCFPTAFHTSSTFEDPARLWTRDAVRVLLPCTTVVKTSGLVERIWPSLRVLV